MNINNISNKNVNEIFRFESRVTVKRTDYEVRLEFIKEPLISFLMFCFFIITSLGVSIYILFKVQIFGLILLSVIIIAIPILTLRFLKDILNSSKEVIINPTER